ncbi:FRG domain-containing protein [Aeromonas salmonicida]|nr:FRG domain-containing protein [Aeromonas salmonicida]
MCWPRDESYRLLALAQHYGVPTRLLDWTTNPLVAVFLPSRE